MFLVKGYHDINYRYRYLIFVIILYETVMKIDKKMFGIYVLFYIVFL
jgi:hypothetical protein